MIKNKKMNRMLSIFLIMVMVFTAFPISTSADDSSSGVPEAHGIQNADGVIFEKTAVARDDGTVDITIDAYTTGQVTSHETVTPTDIVLVLDVSGSMKDPQKTTQTQYTEVDGSQQNSYGMWNYLGLPIWQSGSWSGVNYYVKQGDNYIQVYRAENENNDNYQLFYYVTGSGTNAVRTYVYPELASGIGDDAARQAEWQENNPGAAVPEVVQFYTMQSTTTSSEEAKIDILKTAVKNFIDETAAKNALLSNSEDMHRISIVKFADDSYYGGTISVTEGNHTFRQNGNTYNYTEVVKNLTVVDSTGAAALKTAVDSLQAGGATAVDFGV